MIKAAVMGIAAAMLALYMKSVRPEYSSMISISAGIFIFGFALICLQKITGSIQTLGEYLAGLVAERLKAEKKENFVAARKGIPNMALASEEERKKLIAENSAFADVVCRCELVTEGEILAAIHRPVGATTLDGVKRRTRAGMGRCQAGFCSPRTVELLARELNPDMAEITKNEKGSEFLTGYIKNE